MIHKPEYTWPDNAQDYPGGFPPVQASIQCDTLDDLRGLFDALGIEMPEALDK